MMVAVVIPDIGRIGKLRTLTNIVTFWDDVKKITQNVTNKYDIDRWQCLAKQRFAELKDDEHKSIYAGREN